VAVTSGVRLNLGAGDYRIPGYLGVDQSPLAGVDLVLTVPPLPWPDDSVDAIYMGHFLEHLDQNRGRELLAELRALAGVEAPALYHREDESEL